MQSMELTNDRLSLTVRLGGVLLRGPKGDPGVGVPPGGAAGQMLVKKSGTDYDTEWRASVDQKTLDGLQKQIGDLAGLATNTKDNLVAAINEIETDAPAAMTAAEMQAIWDDN